MARLKKFLLRVYRAISNRATLGVDYVCYRKALRSHLYPTDTCEGSSGNVLFVAGRGMNIGWAQMWVYLSLAFRQCNITPSAVLYRRQRLLRLYFQLVGAKIYYLDTLAHDTRPDLLRQATTLRTVEEWKALHYRNMPLGEMILSTYCRHRASGYIDIESGDLLIFAKEWLISLPCIYDAAQRIYCDHAITHTVFSETFIEEYGAFYFAAIDLGLEIIKTSGTVRDNAILVQRRSAANIRLHHAALAQESLRRVQALENYSAIKVAVDKNFSDRYSTKWHRSARNHRRTTTLSRAEGRAMLGIPPEAKVAIVFSHILYDALFHYGNELYQDYATWLAETVKIAARNPQVEWYIKLHPSNLWRGEFQSLLGGRYEEETVIQRHMNELPAHIHLIYADTPISPMGWYQLADYGISVRGTAGLEMACLGKTVITAGTGRYEGNGFTIDPPDIAAYEKALLQLHTFPMPTSAQQEIAVRYAHGLFNLKPFTLSGLETRLSFGKRIARASDDIIYIPKPRTESLPEDLSRFMTFLRQKEEIDLMVGA